VVFASEVALRPLAIPAELSEARCLAAGKKRGFCQRGGVEAFGHSSGIERGALFWRLAKSVVFASEVALRPLAIPRN
jgi:hypothetical protein